LLGEEKAGENWGCVTPWRTCDGVSHSCRGGVYERG